MFKFHHLEVTPLSDQLPQTNLQFNENKTNGNTIIFHSSLFGQLSPSRRTHTHRESHPEAHLIFPTTMTTRALTTPLTNPVVDGVLQCFHVVPTEMYVSLAPQYLALPLDGVKQQHLDHMVMNYHAKARGVVVGYDHVSIESNNPLGEETLLPIDDLTPYSFFWVRADLMVWAPQIGDVLEGHIYMQTASHLGLLVNDTFNALVKKHNLPLGWQFQPSDADTDSRYGLWLDENEQRVEGKIKFTVKLIHSSGRVVSLEGTLVDPSSEQEAQPVTLGLKHVKFDDDDDTAVPPPLPELVQREAADDDMIPRYEDEDDDDDDEEAGGNDDDESD